MLTAINSVFTFYYRKQINFLKITEKAVNLLNKNYCINDIGVIILQTFYLPYVGSKQHNQFLTEVCLCLLNMKQEIDPKVVDFIRDN